MCICANFSYTCNNAAGKLEKKMGWGGVLRNAVNDAVDTVNVTPYLSEFPSSYDILFH